MKIQSSPVSDEFFQRNAVWTHMPHSHSRIHSPIHRKSARFRFAFHHWVLDLTLRNRDTYTHSHCDSIPFPSYTHSHRARFQSFSTGIFPQFRMIFNSVETCARSSRKSVFYFVVFQFLFSHRNHLLTLYSPLN